jgi:hypothetical protein
MFSWIDWPVLIRQLLLVAVPVLVAKGWLPVYLADPLVDLATYLLGTVVVGWVIWIGQRREKPEVKIAETAALPQVGAIIVDDPAVAKAVTSPKVVT